MQWWIWLLIVIAVCLLVCAIIFVTNSKQKNNQKLFEQDEKLLQSMQGKLDYLIVLCGTNVEIKERLEGIQEKIKYFEPSKNTLEQDKRITERIDDLKIDVSRAVSKGVFHLVSKRIGELELFIVERSQFEKIENNKK